MMDKYKHGNTGSSEYRRNVELIRRGGVTPKYTRILPFVPGERVLELGSAEGVLSLLLAEKKCKVYAVEHDEERHREALRIQELWKRKGFDVDRCEFILGDIRDCYGLLKQVDTFVAIKSLYYLGDDIEQVFERVSNDVKNVVLCGQKTRNRVFFEERGSEHCYHLGRSNYYASFPGMWALLESHGYQVCHAVPDGDPLVVGKRK